MPRRWLNSALAQILLVGIEPYEVEQALDRRRSTRPVIHPSGIPVIEVRGTTSAGRRLTVYLKYEGGFDTVIVGAVEDREVTP